MTLALRIKFTPTYPEEVPELSIETLDGSIETDEHEKLYSKLTNEVLLLCASICLHVCLEDF